MKNLKRYWAVLLLFVGCAGWERSCSSCTADNFGADWVVVQMDVSGRPFRCWTLRNTSITNEENSDGIYWLEEGNLVHISGNYNRIQVVSRNWTAAYHELGLTQASCRAIAARHYDPTEGLYKDPDAGPPPTQETP